ncbi:MAG: hypothetical protein WBV22_08015 [Anaerolineaceae bacterium]
MPQEFSPKDQIIRSLRLWWVLILTIIAGGLIGYTISRLRPPVYEAKATLYTFIKFQDIRDIQLSQYDEDMIINSVGSMILSNDVIGTVLTQAAEDSLSFDYKSFMRQMSVYRKLSDFELFFRDSDPVRAQKMANLWANDTVQIFNRMQRDGYLPLYLTVNIGSLADLPVIPTYSQTNSYVLSGAIIGFLVGITLTTNPYIMVSKLKVTRNKKINKVG